MDTKFQKESKVPYTPGDSANYKMARPQDTRSRLLIFKTLPEKTIGQNTISNEKLWKWR